MVGNCPEASKPSMCVAAWPKRAEPGERKMDAGFGLHGLPDRNLDLTILVVRNVSESEGKDVQSLVIEEDCSIIGKWKDYTLLNSNVADSVEATEETDCEAEEETDVITSSSNDAHFVEEVEDDDDSEDDDTFRGKLLSENESWSRPDRFLLKNIMWSGTTVDGGDTLRLADVGVKEVRLELKLILQESLDEISFSSIREGGNDGPGEGAASLKQAKKVVIALGSVTFQVVYASDRDDAMNCVVVHEVEIEVKPAGPLGSQEHCFFVEVWPNASEGRQNELNQQRSLATNAELSLSSSADVGVKVGATASRTVSDTLLLHAWEGCPDLCSRSAKWTWSIRLDRNGRPFNPSRTQTRIPRRGSVSEFLMQLLPPALVGNKSVQLSGAASNVKAEWTVDAGCEFPFEVRTKLRAIAFRRSFERGNLFRLFSSRNRPTKLALEDRGHISIKLASSSG